MIIYHVSQISVHFSSSFLDFVQMCTTFFKYCCPRLDGVLQLIPSRLKGQFNMPWTKGMRVAELLSHLLFSILCLYSWSLLPICKTLTLVPVEQQPLFSITFSVYEECFECNYSIILATPPKLSYLQMWCLFSIPWCKSLTKSLHQTQDRSLWNLYWCIILVR